MAKTGRNPLTNSLEDAVQYREIEKRDTWPTPRARDWKDGYGVPPSVEKGTRGHTLGTKVQEEEKKMWPTPRASNPGSRPNGKGGKILAEEVLIAEGLRERGKNKNDK